MAVRWLFVDLHHTVIAILTRNLVSLFRYVTVRLDVLNTPCFGRSFGLYIRERIFMYLINGNNRLRCWCMNPAWALPVPWSGRSPLFRWMPLKWPKVLSPGSCGLVIRPDYLYINDGREIAVYFGGSLQVRGSSEILFIFLPGSDYWLNLFQ